MIISDLNLTLQESIDLDAEINRLKSDGFNITLQLLDHHITGKKVQKDLIGIFWMIKEMYHKIVYDYLIEKFDVSIKIYKELVDCINAVDIWLENEKIILIWKGFDVYAYKSKRDKFNTIPKY